MEVYFPGDFTVCVSDPAGNDFKRNELFCHKCDMSMTQNMSCNLDVFVQHPVGGLLQAFIVCPVMHVISGYIRDKEWTTNAGKQLLFFNEESYLPAQCEKLVLNVYFPVGEDVLV